MIYPPLNDLMKKVSSRYSLVIATAKRARDISESDPAKLKYGSTKPVTIALNEINDGTIELAFEKAKKNQIEEVNDIVVEEDSDVER